MSKIKFKGRSAVFSKSNDFNSVTPYKLKLLSTSDFSVNDLKNMLMDIRHKARNQSVANHIFRDLMEIAEFRNVFTKMITCSDLNVIENTLNAMSESTVDSNLEFIAITISFYIENVRFLTEKKKIIEQEILKLNHDGNSSHLDEVVEKCGMGIWVLANKMSYLYFAGLDEKVLEFRNSIPPDLDKLSEGAVLYEFTKARSTATYENYVQSLNRQLEDIKFYGYSYLEDHLKFTSNFEPNDLYRDVRVLISFNSLHRLSDLYFFFIRMLKYCFIHNIKISRTLSVVMSFYKDIGDDELSLLFDKLNENYTGNYGFESEIKNILELYIKEDYRGVIAKSKDVINLNPSITLLYEIVSKSNVTDQDLESFPKLSAKIIKCYSNLDKKIDVEQSLKELKLMYLNFKQFDWAYHLKAKVERFSFKGGELSSKNYNFADMSQIRIMPFDSEALLSFKLKNKLDVLVNYFSRNEVLRGLISNLVVDSDDNISEVPIWRFIKIRAEYLTYMKKYQEALPLYESLVESYDYNSCKIELNSKLIACYFFCENYDLSIIKLSKNLLAGDEASVYPLSIIANYIKNNVNKGCSKDLLEASAIVLYFYNIKYPQDDVTQYISNIVEQLMISTGIYDAKNLLPSNWDASIFLLTHVVSIDVMDGFIFIFDDDLDMYSSKLNICNHLLKDNKFDLSKKHYAHVVNEYSSTFNRMILHICNSDLNEGRINIDKESLKVSLLDDISSVVEKIDRNVTYNDIKFIKLKSDIADAVLSGSKNVAILADCILQISKEYTINKLHGLDNCLNLRFRHGEILNHLRAPLRSQGIAGNKLDDSEFNVDEVFKDFSLFNSDSLSKAKEAHSNFLFELNTIFMEFRSRCSVDFADFIGDKEKFFNYSLSSGMIYDFINDFSKGKSIDALIESVFSWMDKSTEEHLLKVRTQHIPELRSKANKLFEDLLKELKATPNVYRKKLSLSKSGVNDRITSMSNWFDWSGEPSTPFNFGAAFEKATKIVESLYPNLNLNKNFKDEFRLLFKPGYFTTLVTIFSLAIENSAKHCGQSSDINLSFYARNRSRKLYIEISNSVCDALICSLENKISSINKDLSNDFGDKAAKDSGSGIFKIKSLLVDRLKLLADIEVGLESNKFLLSITIDDIGKLTYENPYS